MKKYLNVLFFSIGITVISAFTLSGDVLSQIGCSSDVAKNAILDNFVNSSLNPPSCGGVYKTISATERTSIVNQLFAFIKTYVNSEEFRSKYKAEHESEKPTEPAKEEISSNEDQTQLLLKGMEEQLNSPYLNAEQKEELKKSIETMKQTVSTPEYKQMAQQITETNQKSSQEEYEKKMVEYKSDLAEWEKLNDIKYMLKKRLNAFLELTSNINFDAKLVKQFDKWKFEDEGLESKSREWKMCFRCGRETISAARVCATNWLKELGQ